MRVEELVGKVVVRVRCIETGGGGFSIYGREVDAGYTTTPIFIEAVEGGVAYYRDKPAGEVSILGARYRDDQWCPVAERFLPKVWRETKAESEVKK